VISLCLRCNVTPVETCLEQNFVFTDVWHKSSF
jgi:hypothetical protein